MGGHYGSVHAKGADFETVRQVIQRLASDESRSFYISPPINGWVSVFGDNFGVFPIGEAIAEHVNGDVIEFLVHDDSVFYYWYFRGGRLTDKYNSCPDYFGEEPDAAEREAFRGRPEVFGHLLASDDELPALREILRGAKTEDAERPARKGLGVDMPPDEAKLHKHCNGVFKKLKAFMEDPQEILEFAEANQDLIGELMEPFKATLLSGEMPDDPMEILEKLPRADRQRLSGMLVELALAKAQADVAEESPADTEDVANVLSGAAGGFLFASHQMMQFASLLGIRNVLTSYEYLCNGETEDIERWNEFIRIGPSAAE